jgi:2-desacetyl-2-hydroxyethyl bacteriochlorophyllide A dehydrogenase
MTNTFKALYAKGPRHLAFEEVPFRACGPTEVLVQVKAASVCNGSDRNMYVGHPRYKYPLMLGHEPYGIVVERGSQVKNIAVGDGVVWWFSLGAFAEYCYADTAAVAITKLTGKFDPHAASILELAVATARGVKAASIHPDQRALVIGLGPSGLLFTQQLRNRGIRDIEGWEPLPTRAAHGRRFGLLDTFNPVVSREALDDYTANIRPFDLVIDCYADDLREDGQTINAALAVMSDGGTLIKYGHPLVPRATDLALAAKKNIKIIEAAMPISDVQALVEEEADHFLTGKLDLDTMVTHRISLDDVEATLLDQIANPDNYVKAVVGI